LRPHLYLAIEKAGFIKEARLKEHYLWDGKFIDAVLHYKVNDFIVMRKADVNDVMTYFDWANDKQVRNQSFSSQSISLQDHVLWFNHKLCDLNTYLYFFEAKKKPVGQVRIEKNQEKQNAVIGISIDMAFRGKGFGYKLLVKSIDAFFNICPQYFIKAYIKKENRSSVKAFLKAGFKFEEEIEYQGFKSLLLIYKQS
jgi:RimJ/RimL family protein N-acetyltransferase